MSILEQLIKHYFQLYHLNCQFDCDVIICQYNTRSSLPNSS